VLPLLSLQQMTLQLTRQQIARSRQMAEEALALACDPLKWRSAWFGLLAHSADRYMRSPLFLGLMRHNLDVMTRSMALFSTLRPR
jgi:hypothetical protein